MASLEADDERSGLFPAGRAHRAGLSGRIGRGQREVASVILPA
ncbi:MAG TPA: hypothetical protein VFW16_13000 [Streptosporangiaceae bacterium]|nr:hypothetical protein [Streptosporangiaceae bacterium]